MIHFFSYLFLDFTFQSSERKETVINIFNKFYHGKFIAFIWTDLYYVMCCIFQVLTPYLIYIYHLFLEQNNNNVQNKITSSQILLGCMKIVLSDHGR